METKLETNVYASACPTRQVLDLIGDKWAVLVISLLHDRVMRFSELRRCIGGISQKMLTQTLRQLERDGIVNRTAYAEIPPRVEYALTPLGVTLIEPLVALIDWAEENIGEVVASQELYDSQLGSKMDDKE